jgi:hypothetical protein
MNVKHLLFFILLTMSVALAAQVELVTPTPGGGISYVTGDPDLVPELQLQQAGETRYAIDVTTNTAYKYVTYEARLDGNRWDPVPETDDQTGVEVILSQINGIQGANVQDELESIRAALASGGDGWGAQAVNSDATLNGDGTGGSPLSVNQSAINTSQLNNDAGFVTATDQADVVGGAGIDVQQNGTAFTISNTSPDLTVTIVDGGNGNVAVGGTYPNFTINTPNNLDNSPTNEAQTLEGVSSGGTAAIQLSDISGTGGGTVEIVGAGGIVTSLDVDNNVVIDGSNIVGTGGGNNLDEREELTLTEPSADEVQLNLTTTGGTTGNRGTAIVTVGTTNLSVELVGNKITITDTKWTGITAANPADAANQGVPVGKTFITADPNTMGLPAGIQVERKQ